MTNHVTMSLTSGLAWGNDRRQFEHPWVEWALSLLRSLRAIAAGQWLALEYPSAFHRYVPRARCLCERGGNLHGLFSRCVREEFSKSHDRLVRNALDLKRLRR